MMYQPIETSAMRWCILRTSGGNTLSLARSLRKAGFEVWTPEKVHRRRRPRSKETIDIDLPILPTFVFARADRVADLQAAAVAVISPHPAFSIFRHAGRIPLVADREVRGLRDEEERARIAHLRGQRREVALGSRVQVDSQAFGGLTGVVEASDGKHAMVSFGGSFRVKIEAWLLRTDEVQTAQPVMGIAA